MWRVGVDVLPKSQPKIQRLFNMRKGRGPAHRFLGLTQLLLCPYDVIVTYYQEPILCLSQKAWARRLAPVSQQYESENSPPQVWRVLQYEAS